MKTIMWKNRILRGLMIACALVLTGESYGQVFTAELIPDNIWERMQGRSYPEEGGIARSELRWLRLSYYDFDRKEHVGEMVCNRLIADDMLYIFRELYREHYPIARMRLTDEYGGSDIRSMADNNTSCFCHRNIAGSNKLSKHGRGMAVDINPLYNPCVYLRTGKVEPKEGEAYARDRNTRKDIPGKIDTSDLCYRLFTERGFKWGGHWKSLRDYQHFEK